MEGGDPGAKGQGVSCNLVYSDVTEAIMYGAGVT